MTDLLSRWLTKWAFLETPAFLYDGPALVEKIEVDGLLIDTFNKSIGKGLLDYYDVEQIAQFVDELHAIGKEAWIAGSISLEQLPGLWNTKVDVICVRGAACEPRTGEGRFGEVSAAIVVELVNTMPG